jgi:hypothetical protein
MTEKYTNSVHIDRSTVGDVNVAAGPGARASFAINRAVETLRDRHQDEMASLLQALTRAIEQECAQFEEPAEVERTLDVLATELAANAKPNKTMVQALLDGIMRAAPAAAAIAEAARALGNLVQQMSR